MRPPEVTLEARRWLRYAVNDLSGAEAALALPGMVPRHACWLAQQAAEKATKAALVLLQIAFPRTHDLDALLVRLPADWAVRAHYESLATLSQWAVEARHPSEMPDATWGEASEAVHDAASAVKLLSADMARHGIDSPL